MPSRTARSLSASGSGSERSLGPLATSSGVLTTISPTCFRVAGPIALRKLIADRGTLEAGVEIADS